MPRTINENSNFEINNDSIYKETNENDKNKYDDIVVEKEQELLFVYSSKIKKLGEELVDRNNKVKTIVYLFHIYLIKFTSYSFIH